MSPGFKQAILVLFLLCTNAHGEDRISTPECASDVCVSNIVDPRLATFPCTGNSVLVAYSQTSGVTLINCTNPGEGQSTTYVFHRGKRAAKSYEVEDFRFLRPEGLVAAGREGIPDRFGAVPLCPSKVKEAPVRGALLLAEKRPSDSADKPYCYMPAFTFMQEKTLIFRTGDGVDLAPASPKTVQKWAKLKSRILQILFQ